MLAMEYIKVCGIDSNYYNIIIHVLYDVLACCSVVVHGTIAQQVCVANKGQKCQSKGHLQDIEVWGTLELVRYHVPGSSCKHFKKKQSSIA